MIRFCFVMMCVVILSACGGSGSSTPSPTPVALPSSSSSSSSSSLSSIAESSSQSSGLSSSVSSDALQCSRNLIAAELTQQLGEVVTDTDFSFYLEHASGDSFTFNRGVSTLNTPYQSASTSKMVTAAVILRLVDQGLLHLIDQPAEYIPTDIWSFDTSDPLYGMTLSELLSFSSGLTEGALCVNAPGFNYQNCVGNIVNNNKANGKVPGTEFYYGSSHMQVAGLMAVYASGFENWQALFESFKAQTGLFPGAVYNLPSLTNPRLAGGMTWTGKEYADFLRAYKNSELYSTTDLFHLARTDKILSATIGNSPAFNALGEAWHYGYGLWLECHSAAYNCEKISIVSSPGAYGAYPFINTENDYFGIIAREGVGGTFKEGYLVFDSVRDAVEDWGACTFN